MVIFRYMVERCRGDKHSENGNNQENKGKAAIVYFSGTGNTREVAKLLAKEANVYPYKIMLNLNTV